MMHENPNYSFWQNENVCFCTPLICQNSSKAEGTQKLITGIKLETFDPTGNQSYKMIPPTKCLRGFSHFADKSRDETRSCS